MKFLSHVVQEQENYVAYTLQNFISDCGGLIGLFLGFSLLTFVEKIYKSVALIYRKIKEFKSRKKFVVRKVRSINDGKY